MIQSFKPWLPATALHAEQLEERLGQAVDEWSRKWFARRPARLKEAPPKDRSSGRAARAAAVWQTLDEGLAFGVAADASSRIAAGLLDLAPEEKLAAPGDEAIVERMAEACLDDLRTRLCRLLGLAETVAWRRDPAGGPQAGDHVWEIEAGGQPPLVWLGAGPELLVRLAKMTVAVAPETPDLRPLREGLARQPIRLCAFLGSCELTLSQVASLAPGDVLVLDSAVGEPLDLCIQPGDRSGRCTVEQDRDQLQLKIVRSFFE